MSSLYYYDDDEPTMITATICVTLQFLRLSMDMIQVASTMDYDSSSSKNSDPTSDIKKSTSKSALTSESASAQQTKTKYGSIQEEEEEGKPLLLSKSEKMTNGGEDTRESSNNDDEGASSSSLSSTTTRPRHHHADRIKTVRFVLFCTCWIVLSVIFLSVDIIYQAKKKKKKHEEEEDNDIDFIDDDDDDGILFLFPSSLLTSSFVAYAVESILLYRDYERQRYGKIQRLLQLLAIGVLWAMYITRAFGGTTTTTSSDDLMSKSSQSNLVLLIAATVSVVLVILDAWLANKRPTPARRYSLEQAQGKAKLSWETWSYLLKPYFWPDATSSTAFWNRVRAIGTWVCVVSSKVCGLVAPLLLGKASTYLAHQDYRGCIEFSILYALFAFLASTFKEGQSLVYLSVAQAAFVQLSETAFEHLHHLSLDWHLRKKMGEVLRSMDRGILACDTLMKYLFLWLLPAMAECLVVTVIFATYFHYLPLAIAVFYFVFAYVILTILVTLWRKKFRKALVRHDNEWHDLFTDSMLNFETVKYFTAEEYEKERFAEAVGHFQARTVDVKGSLSFLNCSQQLLLQACMATALSLAAIGIKERMDCCVEFAGCESGLSDCCRDVDSAICPGGLQVGDFVAVLSYIGQLFAPLNFLGSVYNAVVMAMIDLTNLSELLAENPDVVDAPNAFELPRQNVTQPDVAVEFDNVYFHYPTQPEGNGLQGLSFKMMRGTTTAIVGPTGAGKTTVSRLLFRFYDVLGGAVKVNGVDVRSITQASLRGAIGVVPQAASMFNDTIRNNLRYGRRDATDEEVEQAARDAQLLKFIESMNDGWDSMVGDRGLKLSGGEKQKAAIARCLLKDPPFVLLDEATSALDTITENSIQEALDRLGAERTVLVIAHRLGTIRNADNIVVLKAGKVAEQGTHDQLLALNGVYAEMWNMQLHSTADNVSS